MSLTASDLEKMQQQLPDYPMELVDGEVIVMSPSGYESDEVVAGIVRLQRFSSFLSLGHKWAY